MTDRVQVLVSTVGHASSSGGRTVPVSLRSLPFAVDLRLPVVAAPSVPPAPPPAPPSGPRAPFGRCAGPGCDTALPSWHRGEPLCHACVRLQKPWTDADRAMLARMLAEGRSRAQMSAALYRSIHAIDAETARQRGVR